MAQTKFSLRVATNGHRPYFGVSLPSLYLLNLLGDNTSCAWSRSAWLRGYCGIRCTPLLRWRAIRRAWNIAWRPFARLSPCRAWSHTTRLRWARGVRRGPFTRWHPCFWSGIQLNQVGDRAAGVAVAAYPASWGAYVTAVPLHPQIFSLPLHCV